MGQLVLSEAGPKGLGVFALRGFSPGERLLTFKGQLRPTSSIEDFTHTIQVDIGLFLGPSGELDDYVNHSCDPNCGLRSDPPQLGLVALRSIAQGEEISFDYSTCLLDEPDLERCNCGSAKCRGRIGPFESLSDTLRAFYLHLNVVPRFMLGIGNVAAGRRSWADSARRI